MTDRPPSLDPASAGSLQELGMVATAFAKTIGCEYFSYMMISPPKHVAAGQDTLMANYPEEWLGRYTSRTYKLYDPVITIGRKNRIPYFWGQRGFLREYNKAARYVFHEASEFGILEGYAIPTAGPELDGGIFSVATRERNEMPDIVREGMGDLLLFAVRFHDAVVNLAAAASGPSVKLSSREGEVLTWTAEGYSSEAVAARLGLSSSAVNYHITNCCRKLGASNKIQAVALAIRAGLI